ncbi:hypothetical protein ACFL58_01405 [Elusimicrobiota bacterium]
MKNNVFLKKVIYQVGMAVLVVQFFSVFCSAQLSGDRGLIQSILENQIVVDVVEGDLNDDGNKEYAVFSYKKGTEATGGSSADAVQCYYQLSIFAKQGSEMELLWTDEGSYGYYEGLLSPQHILLGIGEILNDGTKYLVVRYENDDSYDLLLWEDGELVIDQEISLTNGKVKEYDEKKKKPADEFMYGEFSIVEERDGTKLKMLVSNVDEKVIKIDGDTYIIE